MIEAFLYPQTTLYPLGLLKFLSHLKRLYLLDLGTSRDIYDSLIPDVKEKIYFVSPKEQYREVFQRVILYTQQLKSFGEYIRYPENLKYYQLYRDLFEEHFYLTRKDGEELGPIEKALIVLLLAEEIDRCYFEVSLKLKKFMTEWKRFFDEKILYSEGVSPGVEEFYIIVSDDHSDFESLQNINHRKKAFRLVIDLFMWENIKEVDTLLITDKAIINDITDDILPSEKVIIDDLLLLFKFSESLNSVLGFPKEGVIPQFSKILTFS